MLPIGLALLLLTGIGPLLAWRKSTVVNLRDQFLVPGPARRRRRCGVLALGVRVWSAGLCFAFSGLVVGTILRSSGAAPASGRAPRAPTSSRRSIGLVGRNKRRYGGYVVHVGVVLIFLGFAGSNGFKQEEDRRARPGQTMTVGGYTVRFDALKVTDDGQKQMVTGHITVLKDGKEYAKMYPARWSFRQARGRADQRSGHPAVIRGRPLHRDAELQPRRADRERRVSR